LDRDLQVGFWYVGSLLEKTRNRFSSSAGELEEAVVGGKCDFSK
jgi:hypothetical protein